MLLQIRCSGHKTMKDRTLKSGGYFSFHSLLANKVDVIMDAKFYYGFSKMNEDRGLERGKHQSLFL